jgi:hypothetical protein
VPIFLSVWSAVSQTMIIRQGSFLGIELGANVSTQVFSLNIGAIILFILMSGLQIFSMKLPNIIRKRHESYKTKQLDDRVKKLEAAAESIQHKIKKVNIKKEEEFSSKVDDAVNEIEELLK